jgi:uncharacterized protein
MPQVELSKIIIDERRQDQIIVLREKGGTRQFPIVIGFLEASSIKMQLSGVAAPRPMTHDLLVTMAQQLGAKIERLTVDDLIENTFHAKLVLKKADGAEVVIDCRPSDGVALAVRAQVPIFVEEVVFKKATILKVE